MLLSRMLTFCSKEMFGGGQGVPVGLGVGLTTAVIEADGVAAGDAVVVGVGVPGTWA